MIVDPGSQSAGTLIGLENQLVLKSMSTSRLTRLRRIIIPYGEVDFCRDQRLPVKISTEGQKYTRYELYTIDDEIGRLVGSSTLMSELYIILLHAYTSHCTPDSLIGHTGCEEALMRLQSASCFSFQRLHDEEMHTLHKIAALTPQRFYYPRHLRNMQSITWAPLPILSQHNDYLPHVQKIINFARDLGTFTESAPSATADLKEVQAYKPDELGGITDLHRRARARCGLFYPNEYRTSDDRMGDQIYSPRHKLQPNNNPSLLFVRQFSRCIRAPPSELPTTTGLLEVLTEWADIRGPTENLALQLSALSYSHDWLSPRLSQEWLSLYKLFQMYQRRGEQERLFLKMLFSFSAAGYANVKQQELFFTLLSFALRPPFSAISPPESKYYDLAAGFLPSEEKLKKLARSSIIAFDKSAAASTPRNPGESEFQHQQRCVDIFSRHCLDDASAAVSSILAQWPRKTITFSGTQSHGTINAEQFLSKCQKKYREWYNNRELMLHVQAIQTILNQFRGCRSAFSMLPIIKCHNAHPAMPLPSGSPQFAVSLGALLARRVYMVPGVSLPELHEIMTTEHAAIPGNVSALPSEIAGSQPAVTRTLRDLLREFQDDDLKQLEPTFRKVYGAGLWDSFKAMSHHEACPPLFSGTPSLDALNIYRTQCHEFMSSKYTAITQMLSPESPLSMILLLSGLWPRWTPRILLQQLSPGHQMKLAPEWRSAITSLALGITRFQHSQRLLDLRSLGNTRQKDISAELCNTLMVEDDALQHPDWLLIQVRQNS